MSRHDHSDAGHHHDHPHDHDHDQEHDDPRVRRSASLKVADSGEVATVTPAAVEPPKPRRYWRSLEERAGTPNPDHTVAAEFPPGADQLEGVPRRDFIQLLGASLAVTGTACTRPYQKIVPYVRRPPEVTPGNALHFATAHSLDGFSSGLLVDSHAGRPTKIEGNPDHPETQGATSVLDQALPMGLYDQARAKDLRRRGTPLAWRSLLGVIAERSAELAKDGGAKLRFLVEPSSSPLHADLRARILDRFPRAKFVSYSPVAAEGEAEGARLAFGSPLEAQHDLRRADVILSLDADFLTDGPQQIRLHRQFSARRVPAQPMNRLYVVEPCLTPTGTMADHRLRVRGSEVVAVAQAVLSELAKLAGMEALAPLALLPRAQPQVRVDTRWAVAAARDLHRARGRSLVIAGRRQPAAVHALCNALNVALGNVGSTVAFRPPVRLDSMAGMTALQGLVSEIAAGAVEVLVITARNPVYGAPSDFKLDKLLPRVPDTLYLSLYEDETAPAVSTFIPAAHVLESWGDTRAVDGTVSLIQPLINPLWSSTTEADVLAAFLGDGDHGSYRLLRDYWEKRAVNEGWTTTAGFEAQWETWLGKGVIDRTVEPIEASVTVDGGGLATGLGPLLSSGLQGAGGLEVAFTVDHKVYDGRFANNAWLQELPHPITKITWDNAVLISQTTAQGVGLKTGDLVRVEIGDRSVTGPVYVQPGHADDAITLALGYGRKGSENVALDVGFAAGRLRTSEAPWFVRGAGLTKVSGLHRFGITQEHWSMEDREPALAVALSNIDKKDNEYRELLEARRGPMEAIQKPVDYSHQPYKWAMSIDLSKCSGCNACVVACQSENNIPVVGRENVRIGREMQWIRIDRYYERSVEDPETVTQPVMCVHCETAPCEYVCPVNATVHSDEGLNEMVYNRCIGTRYCSNNCPYKARRFNFMDYHGDVSPVAKMQANPNVTVRSRGIMEKCTYCVQRIERKRIDARIAGRAIGDQEIQTACQQGCPAEAIVFGSLNDPTSQVSRQHQDDRRYDLLHELGTRPRTAYLSRVRNPNPELA
jgi:molybdopterin-containing oxidoreductase family iron-sulfur binding subunit